MNTKTFGIRDNKLVSDDTQIARASTTKKSRGRLNPRFLVIHYTASANYAGDVRTLSTGPEQASCHLVIGPNGEITQVGDFTHILWHVGASEYQGVGNLNAHSIGIEVTAPGLVTRTPQAGIYRTWSGAFIKDGAPWQILEGKHPFLPGKEENWTLFTPLQIESLLAVGMTLMKFYNMKEAVGHDRVSKPLGRKIDPGLCCPQAVFDILNGRKDDVKMASVVLPEGHTNLHIRLEPNTNSTVTGALKNGNKVVVLESVGGWSLIQNELAFTGYVANSFLNFDS